VQRYNIVTSSSLFRFFVLVVSESEHPQVSSYFGFACFFPVLTLYVCCSYQKYVMAGAGWIPTWPGEKIVNLENVYKLSPFIASVQTCLGIIYITCSICLTLAMWQGITRTRETTTLVVLRTASVSSDVSNKKLKVIQWLRNLKLLH